MSRWLTTTRRGILSRRLQLLLALAVVAAALSAVTASGASFVSTSSTTVQASTSALSADTMAIVAGTSGQSAVAGTAVLPAPSVYIVDRSGNPVAGLTVTFTVQSGGGSLPGGTIVTDVTGDDGVAGAGTWTLGSTPGANTVRATCAGVSGSPLTFTATGTSGPAVRIVAVAGDGQAAVVGTPVATAPAVLVTDAGGNPVKNVNVTFAIQSGGGSVTGWNAQTNAAGIASVNKWTLGTTAGANTLTATSAGLTGSPVTFTATGTPDVASKMVLNDGNGQTVHVGTAVTVPPSVLVTDAYDNAVSGVSVAFTATGGGGSTTGSPATTNASGIARLGSWILGTTAGANTLRATSGSLPPVVFTATGLTGSPTTITMTSGNGQSATVATAVAAAPTVRVTDTYGNPVSGVAVAFAVASGGGSVTGPSVTTNASGSAAVASWTLGTTAGANTLTATSLGLSGSPITFTATGTAGNATRYVVSSSNTSPPISSSVTITAQLADQYNNPVATANIAVAFSKTPSTSGSLSSTTGTTSVAGVATVTLTTGTTVGTVYRVTAASPGRTGTSPDITSIAGTPARMSLSAGNNQSATVNTAVATAPSVLVTDAYNNPVSGVSVTFAVASGGGSVTGASATTNASGIATLGRWTLGTTAGANTLTATSAGLSGSPVVFAATGVAGPATRYVVTASNYNPVAGTAVTITAQLADQYGNPVATSGIRVRFSKSGTGGFFTATRVRTNAGGTATTTFYTSSTRGRVYTITARSTNPTTRTGTSAPITTR